MVSLALIYRPLHMEAHFANMLLPVANGHDSCGSAVNIYTPAKPIVGTTISSEALGSPLESSSTDHRMDKNEKPTLFSSLVQHETDVLYEEEKPHFILSFFFKSTYRVLILGSVTLQSMMFFAR